MVGWPFFGFIADSAVGWWVAWLDIIDDNDTDNIAILAQADLDSSELGPASPGSSC